MSLPLLTAAALLGSASAQDVNVYGGSWERVTGALGLPPTGSFGHAAWVPGYMVLLGNDTSQVPSGMVDVWRYNVITNTWSNTFDYASAGGWPSNPTGYPPQPFVTASGGMIIALDELAPNQIFSIDSLAPSSAGWRTTAVSPPIPLGQGTRFGQRFVSWGSSLFMWGGITAASNTYRADLWALQLTAALNPSDATSPLPGWNLVSPAPDPVTGRVQDYPLGRVGPSFTGYTIGALLFGGVSTTDGSPPYPACFLGLSPASPAPSQCFFHQNIHAFLPGTTDWFVPTSAGQAQVYTAAAWAELPARGASGGPIPAGRTEHCAGHLGDQLYIYGGLTATGPVSAQDALWTYSLASQSWSSLPAAGPGLAPPTGGDVLATGTFIARHMYVWAERAGGGGELWRFAPTAPSLGQQLAPPAAAAPASNLDAIARGHTAGIVIGILIGLANLYCLYLLVTNAAVDIVPPSIAACVPSGWGWGSKGAPTPGYYSAAPSEYTAPQA